MTVLHLSQYAKLPRTLYYKDASGSGSRDRKVKAKNTSLKFLPLNGNQHREDTMLRKLLRYPHVAVSLFSLCLSKYKTPLFPPGLSLSPYL